MNPDDSSAEDEIDASSPDANISPSSRRQMQQETAVDSSRRRRSLSTPHDSFKHGRKTPPPRQELHETNSPDRSQGVSFVDLDSTSHDSADSPTLQKWSKKRPRELSILPDIHSPHTSESVSPLNQFHRNNMVSTASSPSSIDAHSPNRHISSPAHIHQQQHQMDHESRGNLWIHHKRSSQSQLLNSVKDSQRRIKEQRIGPQRQNISSSSPLHASSTTSQHPSPVFSPAKSHTFPSSNADQKEDTSPTSFAHINQVRTSNLYKQTQHIYGSQKTRKRKDRKTLLKHLANSARTDGSDPPATKRVLPPNIGSLRAKNASNNSSHTSILSTGSSGNKQQRPKKSRDTIFDMIENKQRALDKRLQQIAQNRMQSSPRARINSQQHGPSTEAIHVPPRSQSAVFGESATTHHIRIPRDSPKLHEARTVRLTTQKKSHKSLDNSQKEIKVATRISRMIAFYHTMDTYVQQKLKEKYAKHCVIVKKKYEKLALLYKRKMEEKMAEMTGRLDQFSERMEAISDSHIRDMKQKKMGMKESLSEINAQLEQRMKKLADREKKEQLLEERYKSLKKKFTETKLQHNELLKEVDGLTAKMKDQQPKLVSVHQQTDDDESYSSRSPSKYSKSRKGFSSTRRSTKKDSAYTEKMDRLMQQEIEMSRIREEYEAKMRDVHLRTTSIERRERSLEMRENELKKKEELAQHRLEEASEQQKRATDKVEEYEKRMEQLEYCRQQLQQARREQAAATKEGP